MEKLLKNPHGAVKIKIEASGQIPAPRVVDDHGGTDLRSLHDGFNLSAIFRSHSGPLGKKEINSTLVVAIAALDKSVGIEDELQAVSRRAEFGEFVSNGLGNEDR